MTSELISVIQARHNWLGVGLYLWKEWEVDRFENFVEVVDETYCWTE